MSNERMLTDAGVDAMARRLNDWASLEPSEWCRVIALGYDWLASSDKLAISYRRREIDQESNGADVTTVRGRGWR